MDVRKLYAPLVIYLCVRAVNNMYILVLSFFCSFALAKLNLSCSWPQVSFSLMIVILKLKSFLNIAFVHCAAFPSE